MDGQSNVTGLPNRLWHLMINGKEQEVDPGQ